MMDINVNSQLDVRNAGLNLLAEKLGPVGFTRFIQQFENGRGDYTKEKYMRPEMSRDEILAHLREYA